MQAEAEHYRIPLTNVSGAWAFHYDNVTAINEAIREARELGEQTGARAMQSVIEQMKKALDRI